MFSASRSLLSRREARRSAVALAAITLAIAGQGLVASRTYVLDGFALYLIAVVLALRNLSPPSRDGEGCSPDSGQSVTIGGPHPCDGNRLAEPTSDPLGRPATGNGDSVGWQTEAETVGPEAPAGTGQPPGLSGVELGGTQCHTHSRVSSFQGLSFSTGVLAGDRPVAQTAQGSRLSLGVELLRQRWLVLAVTATVGLAIVAALWLFARDASPGLAWVYYGIAVIGTPLSVWLLSGCPRLRPCAGWYRTDCYVLGTITVLALFFRLHQIDSLPWGLWWDEAYSGLGVLRIMAESDYRPVYVADMAHQPALFWYSIVPFFWVLGPTPLGLRASAILGGTIGVVATFLLGRELFGRRAGIAASAIVAVMSWHVNFSRIAFNAIWSVTLGALATYFLIQALRTRRLLAFALAGTMLGLGVNMYYTTRLMPFILLACLLHNLGGRRFDFVRQRAMGLLVFGVATLVTVSPLVQFAMANPRDFYARTEQVMVFNQAHGAGSLFPLFGNARDHLLMFNYAGDRNGRHNLPDAPMLDHVVGGLFILGLSLAMRRARCSEFFLLLVWVPVMLIGGVLSLGFETPQALRTIDQTTVVALLAGLSVAALWNQLDKVRVARLRLPAIWAERPAFELSGGTLVAAVILAAIALINYDRYFVRQARDFAVWASFSAAETAIASRMNDLGEDYQIYMGETLTDKPTIHFLVQGDRKYRRFDPTTHLPLGDSSDVAVFIEGDRASTMALVSDLYPMAQFEEFRSPFGGPPVVLAAIIYRDQIDALQGPSVYYYENVDWSGDPVRTERTELLDLQWVEDQRAEMPFSVEVRSTLLAPLHGEYSFRLLAPEACELLIDEMLFLRGGETGSVTLARGMHTLRLRTAIREPSSVTVLWNPPDTDQIASVPRSLLFSPNVTVRGLLGSYYAGPDWAGEPVLRQIDRSLDRRIHILPLPRPYTVEWLGIIDIAQAGHYQFAVESADTSWLYVDGQLVATNDGAPRQFRQGAIYLDEGMRDLRIRYVDETDHTFIKVFWTPPGGQMEIIPSNRLFPLQGAYPEHAVGRPTAILPEADRLPVGVGALPIVGYYETLRFGETGGSAGQLLEPRGVVVDTAGNVYVADSLKGMIKKFDQSGQLVDVWGTSVEGLELIEPVALAIGPGGVVVVLDSKTGWLGRFTSEGKLLNAIGGPTAEFYHPRGLGVDPAGNVYVADTGRSRIVKLGPDGEILGQLGQRGHGPGQLLEPTDILVTPYGYYVADSGNSKAVLFDLEWRVQLEWTIPRSTSVLGPHMAYVEPNTVLVSDPEGRRVVRYDSAGRSLDQIGLGDQLSRPVQITADAQGAIYIADAEGSQIVKFEPKTGGKDQ